MGPCRKPRRPIFSQRGSDDNCLLDLYGDVFNMIYTVYTKIIVVSYKQQVSNGQELGQSEPKSCPQNQNGKKLKPQSFKQPNCNPDRTKTNMYTHKAKRHRNRLTPKQAMRNNNRNTALERSVINYLGLKSLFKRL